MIQHHYHTKKQQKRVRSCVRVQARATSRSSSAAGTQLSRSAEHVVQNLRKLICHFDVDTFAWRCQFAAAV